MLLRVVCPRCGLEIFALPQSAGKVGQCACGGTFVVPPSAGRRPPSNRAAVLLVGAAVAVGLTAGLWPGKRPAAARQPAPAPRAEGPGPADLSRVESSVLPTFPAAPAAAPRSPAAVEMPPPPAPKLPPPPSLGARELFLLYKGDAAGADKRYRGRVVRVRGELAPPPLGAEDGYVAWLVTFGADEVPPAAYPEPVPSRAGVLLRAAPSRQADFRSLPSRTVVEVEGRCAGRRPDPSAYLGAVIVLEDCRLLETSGK